VPWTPTNHAIGANRDSMLQVQNGKFVQITPYTDMPPIS